MTNSAMKLLHVEDDPADALMIQTTLCENAPLSYDIDHVECLKQALNALRLGGYDAVLLDLGLQDTSGLSNINLIQQQNPDIPVIVVSGTEDDTTMIEAINEGAQEYLVKGRDAGPKIRLAIHASVHRKRVERGLYRQANYDPLTGLANRSLFQHHVEQAIMTNSRSKRKQALMFLDMDNFKPINDRLGHDAGDLALIEVGNRIVGCLRQCDLVCRYAGDEFAILLDQHNNDIRYAGATVALKIIKALSRPFAIDGHEIQLSASIGIAVLPEQNADYHSIIRKADTAMYEAKHGRGLSYCFAESEELTILEDA